MGHKDLQLPKAGLYCEERHQRNENVMDDIPSAYGMPLEGEWVICVSSEVGCSGGIFEQAGVDEAEALEPVDTPDKSDTLVIVLIEPDAKDGADIPCVYLGGTHWHACHIKGLGNGADTLRYQPDGSRGLTDGSGGLMDTSNASNSAEIACISHNDNLDMYLGAAGTKHPVHETDGVRNHADALIGHRDTPSIEMETETAENERGNIRTGQIGLRTRDSPYMAEIETSKCFRRWKGVSAEGVDVYLPWDAPVEVPSRTFAFGQVEGAEEAIAPNVERAGEVIAPNVGERAGDSGGDRDGGDVDGTTSGDTIDSTRAEGTWLAEKSQHMRQSQRT